MLKKSFQPTTDEGPGLIRSIIRSPTLLRRVFTTPIWWVTTTFVYYGLSINSVGLSGNMYLNYIITCAIEIPGYYTAVLVLDRIGRKPTISGGFLLSAACCIGFAFLPEGKYYSLLRYYIIIVANNKTMSETYAYVTCLVSI